MGRKVSFLAPGGTSGTDGFGQDPSSVHPCDTGALKHPLGWVRVARAQEGRHALGKSREDVTKWVKGEKTLPEKGLRNYKCKDGFQRSLGWS